MGEVNNVAKERYPATAVPKVEADGGPVQPASVEVHPGAVTRIVPPNPPDVRTGTKPAPEGPSLDETYRA
jgi:hypothetical protein